MGPQASLAMNCVRLFLLIVGILAAAASGLIARSQRNVLRGSESQIRKAVAEVAPQAPIADMRTQEEGPTDPLTILIAAATMIVVALVAPSILAIAAARMQPLSARRVE